MNAVDYIGETDTIHIVTDTKDGREIETPIWGVVIDGVPYIRNAYGPSSKWYARARRAGHLAFADGATRYPAATEIVDDAAELDRVDDAYRAKYHDQGSALDQVIAPAVRGFTLRIRPDGS
ncbi:DUF2255 family protein [Herbiconiux sp. CPCC 205763]|uniref:DUF2255 family protein n=1 Tax=Herbiconiux aconitum TaxID=2970913 RepID=A0ABT2GQG2_9MICO|nr:DUF2255 family protein [Herbiconiux aconitum]MCS5718418.1 DUF2255 family protein [Herbiconiux aconitum]